MKSSKFNIQLRGKILEKALILEELSSHIIKLILRIVWDETKTLGNKSTSLSFKNKVDLLFDLQDISKDEYNYLLKLMEVRNQFSHNIECNLWEDFQRINPKTYQFITKKFPNEDESFSTSFRDMFNKCNEKLKEVENKYLLGFDLEIEKIITNEVFQNIVQLTEKTVKNWQIWCEELEKSELENSINREELKIDTLKKMFVLNTLRYRERLYRVYRTMDFDEFRVNLRRKVDDKLIQDYVKELDKKYEFIYDDDSWEDSNKQDELLEDEFFIRENSNENL